MSEDSNHSRQSVVSKISEELHQSCRSEFIFILPDAFEQYGLTPDPNLNFRDYSFFFAACENKAVNEKTVQFLLEYFPAAASSVSNMYEYHGETPLHVACSNENVTLGIIQLLIEAAPDSVRSVDSYGNMPLHILCCNENVTLGIIQLLVDAAPDSVRSVNNNSQMPLHILCANKGVDEKAAMEDILKLLLEKCPESIRHAEEDGYLPIHFAARRRSPEFCRVLVEAYPGSERIVDDNGWLPLHHACARNCVPTVEYFYKLHPDAINHATTDGKYPIHYASEVDFYPSCMRESYINSARVDVDVVQFLLDCDPNVKLQKYEGKSLLHFACAQDDDRLLSGRNPVLDSGMQIIAALYDAHPEAIEDEDFDSEFFHQEEVETFINDELVYARQANDHSLMITPDEKGQLPLHRALQNNVRLGSIKLLVKGNPFALRSVDNNGALPLHVASQYHDSPSVIQHLLDIHATSVATPDREGNTALHYACRSAKYGTIALLLERHDAVSVSKENAQQKLPIDLLWESDNVEDKESVEYVGSVFHLMKAYPEILMNAGMQSQAREAIRQSFAALPNASEIGKKRKFGAV